MNFAQQLMVAAVPTKDRSVQKEAYRRSRETIRANALARYRAVLANPSTTGEIAGRLGISHMGCLSTLYKMEKLNQIKRVALRETGGNRPTIVWGWV